MCVCLKTVTGCWACPEAACNVAKKASGVERTLTLRASLLESTGDVAERCGALLGVSGQCKCEFDDKQHNSSKTAPRRSYTYSKRTTRCCGCEEFCCCVLLSIVVCFDNRTPHKHACRVESSRYESTSSSHLAHSTIVRSVATLTKQRRQPRRVDY